MSGRAAKWFPWWAYVAVLFLAVGTVWLRLLIVRTTYSINETDRKIRLLQRERDQVELKVAGLKSPRRLEILARTRYGLTSPRSDQVIHLR